MGVIQLVYYFFKFSVFWEYFDHFKMIDLFSANRKVMITILTFLSLCWYDIMLKFIPEIWEKHLMYI